MSQEIQIEITPNGKLLVVAFSGQLLTSNTGKIREQLQHIPEPETKELILDFMDLEYISSAGLRVVLELKKRMELNHGTLKVINVMPDVRSAFDVTGLATLIHLEDA